MLIKSLVVVKYVLKIIIAFLSPAGGSLTFLPHQLNTRLRNDWVHPVNLDNAFLSSSYVDDDDSNDYNDDGDTLQILNLLPLSVN